MISSQRHYAALHTGGAKQVCIRFFKNDSAFISCSVGNLSDEAGQAEASASNMRILMSDVGLVKAERKRFKFPPPGASVSETATASIWESQFEL